MPKSAVKRLIQPVALAAARRRRRQARRRQSPAGAPPGFIEHDRSLDEDAAVTLYTWSQEELHISEIDLGGVALDSTSMMRWLRITGTPSTRQLEVLGSRYGLHKLALEDIVNTDQRPKIERYGDEFFAVVRAIRRREGATALPVETGQLCLYTVGSMLISVEPDDAAGGAAVVTRLRSPKSRLRSHEAHYLLYAIIDSVVDHWFPAIDRLIAELETMEDTVLDLSDSDEHFLSNVHAIKSELSTLRRIVSPIREVSAALMREIGGYGTDMEPFLRDLDDHVTRIIESIDTGRDMCASLFDISISLSQHRMNDVIKVLTVISTIFIPLSFLAGLYGMNFDPGKDGNMPELSWPYAYPTLLGIMLAVAIGILAMFWRWGWLGSRRRPRDS